MSYASAPADPDHASDTHDVPTRAGGGCAAAPGGGGGGTGGGGAPPPPPPPPLGRVVGGVDVVLPWASTNFQMSHSFSASSKLMTSQIVKSTPTSSFTPP